jgi:hypothetical protein
MMRCIKFLWPAVIKWQLDIQFHASISFQAEAIWRIKNSADPFYI